ncbi:hypothetical protein [Streptomyces halstedii]|uniref:Uncharacterized protein n=1 Tax=Streptomyces halstedii TaxID=1944 RepID=A0A6N9U5W2_STRHA|nr:hypothetical protein [Streptomyces halstedii]NEA17403.1 hypothetical protein [Streptomyces halstedii]
MPVAEEGVDSVGAFVLSAGGTQQRPEHDTVLGVEKVLNCQGLQLAPDVGQVVTSYGGLLLKELDGVLGQEQDSPVSTAYRSDSAS